jgi:hypothetical protein
MKLIAYDKTKLENINGFKKSDILMVIEEFTASGMDCVKVEGYTHKSATSCMSSLSNAIKRYKIGGVRALVRKGEVFLIKETKSKTKTK